MLKRYRQQILIGLLIAAAAAASFYVDFYKKDFDVSLMLLKQASDLSYGSLVKPEDTAPLQLPPEIIQQGRYARLPILMYHHVGSLPPKPNKVRLGLTVSTEEFEAQVKWLKDNGYTSVRLDDLYHLSKKQPVSWPKKAVVFTFDDGYTDVFENAVPILSKYGFSGIFGIITSFPGQVQGDNSYATWQQIAAAKNLGMEIICHTQNHFDGANKKYSSDYIYQNLNGCQRDIEDHLGSAENYMIYPYGHSTPTYIKQAQKAGFMMGMTVHEGSLINLDDLMHIPRVRINPDTSLQTFERLMKD